ncbi:MAG: glycosyl hydrolase family 32, partial [Caulobacteraceae bacterium]|nr:glycosyl hydrolase family 32 [Caulobacteraceae bacterium]
MGWPSFFRECWSSLDAKVSDDRHMFLQEKEDAMWSPLARRPAPILACALLIVAGAASAQNPPPNGAARAGQPPPQAYPLYQEPWRPQFHFSQPAQFMNDPNGLIYDNGEWNMFYQLRPGGAIVWGHAVSKDMLHWENLPVAIPAQADGKSIFSGSAVIDYNNTSGLGSKQNPAMVAIYTASGAGSQAQGLAYSLDHGRTFKFYSGNPVLDIGQSQFRDPSVFWYEPSKSWVMAVANPNDHQVSIYSSPDLKKWSLQSKWGPLPPTGGVYECPSLFPLQVDGRTSKTKWVMVVSTNPGGLWGGSMTAAYIGDFDGKTFKEDSRYRYDGPPGMTSLEAFESAGYGQWTASGPAFGTGPQHPATAPAGSAVSRLTGFQGGGLATSLGTDGVGSLTT